MKDSRLNLIVQKANEGDKAALEDLVRQIQDRIYRLALRMLGHPHDAEDAAQEILIKIVTRLDSFRQECEFYTWAFRVAANHLLNTRKRLNRIPELSFEDYQPMFEHNSVVAWPGSLSEAEKRHIVKEVMLGCTQGILLCLDYHHRIAYILGEIFDITSQQGAYILDISPELYRKRLSRARQRLFDYMSVYCDLVTPDAPCNCARLAPSAIETGWIDPDNLVFATHPVRTPQEDVARAYLEEIDDLQRVAVLLKSHPDYAAPDKFLDGIKGLINTEQFKIISRDP